MPKTATPPTATTPPTPAPTRPRTARRVAIGALLAWGVVHVVGGVVLIAAATSDPGTALATIATASSTVPLAGAMATAVAGVVGAHGFTITSAGLVVTLMAWRSRTGPPGRLTVPITIAAVADVGLVAFLLVPGVMAPLDASPGILLLAIAVAASRRAGWRLATPAT